PIHLGEEAGVVLQGKVREHDRQWHLARVEFPGGRLWVRDFGFETDQTIRVRILARDVSLALERHDDNSFLNLLPATVLELAVGDHEAVRMVKIQVGDSFLLCRLTARSAHLLRLEPKQQVWAQIKSVAIIE
ncbi:MAG: TOBE domain-containing protein, partial [Gammaproteobacteria bacterium]